MSKAHGADDWRTTAVHTDSKTQEADELEILSNGGMDFLPHTVNTYLKQKLSDRLQLEVTANTAFKRSESTSTTYEYSQHEPDLTIHSKQKKSYLIGGAEAKTSYRLSPSHSLSGGVNYHHTNLHTAQHDNSALQLNDENRVVENSSSAFLFYAGSLGKVSLNLGLRYEWARSDRSRNGKALSDVDYSVSDLFPTAIVAYQAGSFQHAVMYKQRAAHPSYWQLSGATLYLNRYKFRKGNAALETERTHVFVYQLLHPKFYLVGEYDYRRNAIVQTTRYDGRLLQIMSENYRAYHYGTLWGNAHHSIGFWSPSLTLGVSISWLPEAVAEGILEVKPSYKAILNNDFSLPWGIALGCNLSYYSAGSSGDSSWNPSGGLDLSLSKSFLGNHLALAFYAEDILNTSNGGDHCALFGVQEWRRNHNDTRSFKLSLSYYFNKPIRTREIPSSIEGAVNRAN